MSPLFAFMGLGGGEVALILFVTLLLFGAKRLPQLARGLGQGIREFKKASSEVTEELQRVDEEPLRSPPRKQLPPEGTQAQADAEDTDDTGKEEHSKNPPEGSEDEHSVPRSTNSVKPPQ